MSNNKERNENSAGQEGTDLPEGFTLSMAFMDCLPVLFFALSVGVLSGRLDSVLFRIGAAAVIAAGAMKAGWKFVLALAKRDVPFLSRQMRYVMPAGFVLMLLGLLVDRKGWSVSGVWHTIWTFPAIVFFLLGALGIVFMVYYSGKFDRRNARANWIEQGTNAAAQLCFLLGIIFCG